MPPLAPPGYKVYHYTTNAKNLMCKQAKQIGVPSKTDDCTEFQQEEISGPCNFPDLKIF